MTERCYIEVTTVQPKPIVKSKRIWGKRKVTVREEAKRISALARQPVQQTTLKEVPCVKPTDYVPNLQPAIPYAWEIERPINITEDWYSQFVGPVPTPRANVPVPPTIALISAGLVFILNRRKQRCSS